ncbi:MAG: M24 family metallopeptidase [Sciscionella sp.]
MNHEVGRSTEKQLLPLGETPAPRWLTPEHVATVEAAEECPFSQEEYARRLAAVRDRMAARDLAAILIFRPSSIEYLCGYHTAETAPQPLLVTPTDTFLYVLDLEIGRALTSSHAQHIVYCNYADTGSRFRLIAEHVADVVPRNARVAMEPQHTSTPPWMFDLIEAANLDVVDGDFLVENIKLVLSPAEIRYVEEAAIATQRGVEAAVAAAGRAGATDSSVAASIAGALFQYADAPAAWGPVVVSGRRSGIPHSSWKLNPLDGGPTFLEFAGARHRYHAPVMRTLTRGRPSATTERLAELARTTLAAVLENAKPGVPCDQIAERALQAIGPLRDVEVFHHLFGYPVGLAHPPHWMDSAPFYIARGNPEPLQSGMVFHVPASFRSFGTMGVGLSQTFVVEERGTRVLTHGPAELVQVS